VREDLPDGRGIGSVAITAEETLARGRAARPENRSQLPPVPQGIVAKSALSTDNLRPSTIDPRLWKCLPHL
jgi:hypothetical protein